MTVIKSTLTPELEVNERVGGMKSVGISDSVHGDYHSRAVPHRGRCGVYLRQEA